MAIENGFFLQNNDDGSTTIFQCKHYSCYEDMVQDTNPPHYGICEDTRIRYTFDPVNGWEEAIKHCDTSSVTATAESMLEGVVAVDANGNEITGSIPTVNPTVANNIITVPVGYIDEEHTFDTSSMDFYKCAAVYGPREVVCYVFSGCPETEANGTYLPTEFTTEDWEGNKQTVYSNGGGWYYCYTDYDMAWGLTTDYTSGGLRYSGSLGGSWMDNRTWETVEGMTGIESTTIVDTDVPKTWDGYKAVKSGGVYFFESEVTTGLTYTELKPEKYRIYSSDATVKINWLPEDMPTANLILFAPLTSDLDKADVGGVITHSKTSELGTLDNTDCTVLTNSNDGIYIDCDGIIGAGELTIFIQFAVSLFNQGYIFNIKCQDGYPFGLSPVNNNNQNLRFNNDAAYTHSIEQNKWYTALLVRRKNGELSLFFDGEFKHKYTFDSNILQTLQLGYNWFHGGIRNVLIYNRALSEAEIGKLVDKFGYIYPPTIIVKTSVTLIAYLENEINKQLSATVKYKPGETPTFSSSNMPTGLNISSDGRITGTPAVLGTGSSTVIVSSPSTDSVEITVNWEVRAASEKPIVSEDLIFYAPLTTLSSVAETGQELTYTGTPQVTELNGRSCMLFSEGQGIETTEKIDISGNTARTVCFWALPAEYVPSYPSAVFWGSDNAERSKRVLFGPIRNGDNIRLMFGGWNNDTEFSTNIPLDNKLHHCAMVYTGSELRLFVDGVHGGGSVSGLNTTDSKLRIAYASVVSGYAYSGYLSEVRVYNRALSDAEIYELANEQFTELGDNSGDNENTQDKVYAYTVTFPSCSAAEGGYWENGDGEYGQKNYINTQGSTLKYNEEIVPGYWEIRLSNNSIVAQKFGTGDAPDVGSWNSFDSANFPGPITVVKYSGDDNSQDTEDSDLPTSLADFADRKYNGFELVSDEYGTQVFRETTQVLNGMIVYECMYNSGFYYCVMNDDRSAIIIAYYGTNSINGRVSVGLLMNPDWQVYTADYPDGLKYPWDAFVSDYSPGTSGATVNTPLEMNPFSGGYTDGTPN